MAQIFDKKEGMSTIYIDKPIFRANGQPLDRNEVFYSLTLAEDYAKTAEAYVGQKIVVIENNIVTHYSIIDTNGTLEELGKKTMGDNASIELNGETLSLYNYGKAFYKYVPEVKDKDGNVTTPASYVKVAVSDTNPWQDGLEPRVVTETIDGKPVKVIGWYQQNPTTVEGLAASITALDARTTELEKLDVDGTSIASKTVNDKKILSIKDVDAATTTDGKILAADGKGGVKWVEDKDTDTKTSVKDNDGENKGIKVTKATTPENGFDITYEIAHETAPTTGTSAANKGTGTGRTYVTDVLVDDMGHIAGVKTATETVVNTDTDTQTKVVSGDDYIVVKPESGELKTGELNTFTVSIDKEELVKLIGASTTAAMEFKGATDQLPADNNTQDGDMWKASADFDLAADKNAQSTTEVTKVKIGDTIVAKVTISGDTKTVKWYYIPSANDQDTWRPVEVNGKAIGDKTLNLKPGYCISLTNNNGVVTIGLNTSDLTIEESNLSNDLKASVAAANNAVEKDRLVEYITATAPVDIISTTEFPTIDDYPGYEGTTLGGNYYITEEEFLLEPNATYILTINSASSSNEKYYAVANKDDWSGDVAVTFNVASDGLVFRSGYNNGTPYTEVWYGGMSGPTPMIGDKEKYIGASMTLQREPIYDLGIEKGAQVNYINDVDEDQFTVTGKKLALNTDLADKIDSALQPVEGAGEGHYAVFDADGKIVDGGYIYGSAQYKNATEEDPSSRIYIEVMEHSGALSDEPPHDNPVVGLQMIAAEDSGIEFYQSTIMGPTLEQNGNSPDRTQILETKIGLTDAVKASLAKADTAVQEITTIDTSADHTHGTETNCGGLKATKTGSTVNIEIDDSITFILNCGSAADL